MERRGREVRKEVGKEEDTGREEGEQNNIESESKSMSKLLRCYHDYELILFSHGFV